MSTTLYRRELRAIARGFWSGVWSQDQFFDLMYSTIDRGLTKAWSDGARQVGIAPDEISNAEQIALATIIFREYSYVGRLAGFILENPKGVKGSLSKIYVRLEVWINRYLDTKNQAKVAAEKDPKLMWNLGRTKDNCETCQKLAGKVKRASYWDSYVMPQQPPNPNLACGGWKCGCTLDPTDEPMSRGRMPNVP